jgi:murein DD-endopeptidase MepM/ murein hydrolase activator NlpD
VDIEHQDAPVAFYLHAKDGVLVEVGDAVVAGDTIAQSGNTGTTSAPTLTFSVHPCQPYSNCAKIPITFNNTRDNANLLKQGSFHAAR